jgi:hypothetical protein
MAFLVQDPVGCKIVVGNKCLQKSKNFKLLGCEISFETGIGIQQNAANLTQILGITNNNFKPTLVRTFSRIKVYNVLAVPILLHESEIWALRQEDK